MISNVNPKAYLYLIALFSGSFLFAQQREDSLLKALQRYDDDTNKVKTLNELGWEFYDNNTEKAMHYAQQAAALADKLNFKSGQVSSYNTIGIVHYFKGNYPEALNYYLKAARLLENDRSIPNGRKKLGALYNNIAAILEEEKQYDESENYFLRSLQIDGETGDKHGMANSYNNIGTLYKDREQYDKAINYYLKALALRKEIHDLEGMPSALTNIGVAYVCQHNIQLGEQYLGQALNLYRSNQDSMGIALTYNNMGDLFYEMKKYPKALACYDSCLKLSLKNSYLSYISYSYASMALVYGKERNFEKAYEYQRLHMSVKDSIYNKEKTQQLLELQTRYETEKKEKELKLQATELQVKRLETDEANRQKTSLRNYFMVFIGFALVCIFILVNRYKLKQKANQQLEEKNLLIEMQKNLVEEKQKEILDSIHYAKRIQQSLLPSEKYIERMMSEQKK